MSDEPTYAEDPLGYYREAAIMGAAAAYLVDGHLDFPTTSDRHACWITLWSALNGLPETMQRMFIDEKLRVSFETTQQDERTVYTPRFWVVCNDLFWWGCSDGEAIEPKEYPSLLATLEEAPKNGAELWCARKRGYRPQGPYYAYFTPEETVLFNAVGPERVAGDGRFPKGKALPYTPPFELRD